ncbi:Uncharacterised protein [Mycobacterium tuberculosis]|nr:Uncharacterised protein [Mycobacterium tuberculosis]
MTTDLVAPSSASTVIRSDPSASRARTASTSRWPTMPWPTTTISRAAAGARELPAVGMV